MTQAGQRHLVHLTPELKPEAQAKVFLATLRFACASGFNRPATWRTPTSQMVPDRAGKCHVSGPRFHCLPSPTGVEPAESCFAGSRRTVWLQRQVKCPRWESNPGFDLRRVACKIQHTPRTTSFSTPPRNRTPSDRFEVRHAVHHTRRAFHSSSPFRNRT